MDIKDLEVRLYFLAGQLEEAKLTYKNAMGEIERANKEEAKRKSESVTADTGHTIHAGEQSSVPA